MSDQEQLSPLEQLAQMGQQQQSADAQPAGQPQQQAASKPASEQLSPLEQLMQMGQQTSPSQPGAEIQPVTTSTNPKLAAAMAAKDMPEYVGAVGATGAGLMAASVLNEATAPVLKHIATEWGQPA